MDNRLNQMNTRKPRGVVGSPYQVLPPVGRPPIVPPIIPPGGLMPPPPPPQNVNIIINKDDGTQGIIDYKQDQSISGLAVRLSNVEFLQSSYVDKSELIEYAKISAVTENLDAIREQINQIPTNISGFDDYNELVTDKEIEVLTSNIQETYDNKISGIVNNVVLASASISSLQDELDLHDLPQKIESFGLII